MSQSLSSAGSSSEGSSFDRLPTQPTTAPPGSRDKVEVMKERAALGLPLFHPSDSRGRSTMRGKTEESPTDENTTVGKDDELIDEEEGEDWYDEMPRQA